MNPGKGKEKVLVGVGNSRIQIELGIVLGAAILTLRLNHSWAKKQGVAIWFSMQTFFFFLIIEKVCHPIDMTILFVCGGVYFWFLNFLTFKGYTPFAAITKYWLHSPCCTMQI